MRYLGGPLFVFYSYVFLSTSEWYKVLSVVFKKERVYLKTLYKIFIEKVMKREAIVGKGACKCGFLSFPSCKYRHLCMHTHLTTHYPNVHSLRGVNYPSPDQSEVAEEVLYPQPIGGATSEAPFFAV